MVGKDDLPIAIGETERPAIICLPMTEAMMNADRAL
jgi:hypothetical protein